MSCPQPCRPPGHVVPVVSWPFVVCHHPGSIEHESARARSESEIVVACWLVGHSVRNSGGAKPAYFARSKINSFKAHGWLEIGSPQTAGVQLSGECCSISQRQYHQSLNRRRILVEPSQIVLVLTSAKARRMVSPDNIANLNKGQR